MRFLNFWWAIKILMVIKNNFDMICKIYKVIINIFNKALKILHNLLKMFMKILTENKNFAINTLFYWNFALKALLTMTKFTLFYTLLKFILF